MRKRFSLKIAQYASTGIDYMTLGKDMTLFHAMAEIKHTAQPKKCSATDVNT